MARGRMIANEVTKDKRVNDLVDDTSRLAFTWLITFADKEGRTHGDPALLRSLLFPRRTDITPEQMEKYVKQWHELGLVEWYEAKGDRWIVFPNFDKHQPGLRKDREPDSVIPPPPGWIPDENTNHDPRAAVYKYYEQIGPVSDTIKKKIDAALEDGIPPEWIADAVDEAVTNEKRSWAYIQAILNSWQENGYKAKTRKSDDDYRKYSKGKYAELINQ